jgi:hypothetical protein
MTPVKWQRSWLVPGMAIAICMLALMYAIARYLPYAVDWHWVLRPGCLALAVATFRRSEIRFAMPAWPD